MSTRKITNRKTPGQHASACFGAALVVALAPPAAMADQSAAPTCNSLVSVAGDLYLVGPAGQVVTRFTSDGSSKRYATVSPDGREVAYVVPNPGQNNFYQYDVANANGQQRAFPVYSSNSDPRNPQSQDFDAMGPLLGLWWNSNRVLETTKHVSPTASFFEFHRIDEELARAKQISRTGSGDGCALSREGNLVACVQDTDISIDDRGIYYESGFPAAPIASFTLTKGNSVATSGDPSFTVKVVGFDGDQVGIEVTSPTAPAVGGTMYLPRSNYIFTVPWNNVEYGFSAMLVDKHKGLVQVNEFRRGAGAIFDSAIAWQLQGHGLLLIRREDRRAILYLIQPRDNDGDGHDSQESDNSWRLVAQTPINLPHSVEAMRFVTPSALFLQTEDGAFSWASIQISGGGRGDSGSSRGRALTMTVSAIAQLPAAVPVTINGSSTQATALDWSCQAPHGKDGDRDEDGGASGSGGQS